MMRAFLGFRWMAWGLTVWSIAVATTFPSAATAATMEHGKVNIRELLKRDFGLDLNISGGSGQSRDDPLVILDTSPLSASLTQMQVLRGIGKGRGILWRKLARTPFQDTLTAIEQVKIETKEVRTTEVITQVENYYFDISASAQKGQPLPEAETTSPGCARNLPYELGWLHYDGSIDNEHQNPGLGQSIAYGAPGTKATIYLYNRQLRNIPSSIDAELVIREFETAQRVLQELHPAAVPLAPAFISKVLHIRAYRVDGDVSLVALGVCRGKFVKVRLTHVDDPILYAVAGQFLSEFGSLLSK
jgi:hypothetical protein